MSLTYTGTDGLFQRISRAYKEYVRVMTAFGSALDSGVVDLFDEYSSGNDAIAVEGLYTARDAFRSVPSSYLSTLVSISQKTMIEQVHRDVPLAQKTLTNALTEAIRQVKADGYYFTPPTISASLAQYGSNYGDGTFVASMKNGYGDTLDMCFDEDIKFTCTSDSGSGATQYRETYSYVSEPSKPISDVNWPGGSGTSGTMSLFDASGQDDLLTNGGFDTWTNSAAAPSGWASVLGTFGTNITRSTDNKRGTYSLALNSNGSALYGIKQQLSTSLVEPNQVILMNLWAKIDTLDASGVVTFKLTDGNGTTLTNDASTSQSYTRNTNGNIGTSYTNITTSFQLPKVIPSTGVYFHIVFSTSPANSRVVTFDLVGLKEGTALYAGGPVVAGFSNATSNALRDYSTLTIANNATVNYWVKALDRFFDLRTKGLYFPTTGSTLINNSLLTA